MRYNRGFTLIEIVVSLIVSGILAAIVTANVLGARQRAQDTAILAAARAIATEQIAPEVSKFPQDRRWGGARNRKFLNGTINRNIARAGRSNIYGYENPVSGSGQIITRGALRRGNEPAVFITNRERYLRDRVERRRQEFQQLRGTIVVVIHRRKPIIQVYYVNTRGAVSDFLWTP